MIKIETMSDDCVATINGNDRVFTGQLFTSRELATLQIAKGELMYTVDELEMVRVKAKVPELSGSANSTSTNPINVNIASANSTSMNPTNVNIASANSTSMNPTSTKKSTKV